MKNVVSYIALALAVFAVFACYSQSDNRSKMLPQSAKETTFDRIMRTQTVRCGYLLSPQIEMKDPNTGVMSGVMVDYVEALAKSLGFKVVWQEEINLSTYLQDLANGRYDLECSGGWPNALRGKQVEYSTPIYYFPFYAVVRADDHRFDNNHEAMNVPEVRMVGHDGGTDELIHQRRFPKAGYLGIANVTDLGDALQEIVNNKADVGFIDYPTLLAYQKNNPGLVRKVDGPPMRLIPVNLSFAPGEFRLQQMLNTATRELLYDGVIDGILDKYETEKGGFLRVSPPYVQPKD